MATFFVNGNCPTPGGYTDHEPNSPSSIPACPTGLVSTILGGTTLISVYHNGVFVATEPGINFIEGAQILLTVVDVSASGYVNVTITALPVTFAHGPTGAIQYCSSAITFAADSGFLRNGVLNARPATVTATGLFQSVAGFDTPTSSTGQSGFVELGAISLSGEYTFFNVPPGSQDELLINTNGPGTIGGVTLTAGTNGAHAYCTLNSIVPNSFGVNGVYGVSGNSQAGFATTGGICTALLTPFGWTGTFAPSWSG